MNPLYLREMPMVRCKIRKAIRKELQRMIMFINLRELSSKKSTSLTKITRKVKSIKHNHLSNSLSAIMFNTLRPRQMDAISQTTFSNAFSWMKMFEFRLTFQWSLFQRFQLTIFQHWFRYWLVAVEAANHYLNQWGLVYWQIYASLGLNELISFTSS